MINNEQIVETYLAYKGKKRTKAGVKNNVLPLMPFFLMDTVYQIYCRDIKNLDYRFEMKRARNRWADSYHKFTMDFFRAFNQDQTDYIVDEMDRFNDYIQNNVVMLKSAAMEHLSGHTDFANRKALGSLLVCNSLAQAAQHLYGEMYRKADYTREVNGHIEEIKKATFDIANRYPVARKVEISKSDKVMNMVTLLCREIVKFLNHEQTNS